MDRIVLILAACGLVLTCPAVKAQARGASALKTTVERDEAEVAADRAAHLEQLDTWLRRLAGRFYLSGEITGDSESTCDRAGREFNRQHSGDAYLGCRGGSIPPPPVKISGNADCVGISAGAGVNCVIQLDWQVPNARLPYSYSPPYRASWFNPGIIMYGIDPNAREIRFLQVSERSIAESARGVLEDNTVTFKLPGRYSSRNMQIIAPPDIDTIEMRVIEKFSDGTAFYRFILERASP